MPNEQRRQELQELLNKAYQNRTTLERRLLAAARDPLARHNYQLDLDHLEKTIERWEAELARLDQAAGGNSPAASAQGQGQQFNVGQQQAGRDINQGNTYNIQHHYAGSNPAQPAAPTPANPNPPAKPSLPNRPLSFKEVSGLVDRLLACPSLSTPAGRTGVIGQLPGQIANAISFAPSASAKADVTSLVRTCLNFPDGLQSLLEIVRFYDDGTIPLMELERYLTEF